MIGRKLLLRVTVTQDRIDKGLGLRILELCRFLASGCGGRFQAQGLETNSPLLHPQDLSCLGARGHPSVVLNGCQGILRKRKKLATMTANRHTPPDHSNDRRKPGRFQEPACRNVVKGDNAAGGEGRAGGGVS